LASGHSDTGAPEDEGMVSGLMFDLSAHKFLK